MDHPAAYARRVLINLVLHDVGRRTQQRVELQPNEEAAEPGVVRAVIRTPLARLVCRRVAVTADSNRYHRLFRLRTGSRRWGVAVAFSMARAGTDAGDRTAGLQAHQGRIPFFTSRRRPRLGLSPI
jgi:hypothetical protein